MPCTIAPFFFTFANSATTTPTTMGAEQSKTVSKPRTFEDLATYLLTLTVIQLRAADLGNEDSKKPYEWVDSMLGKKLPFSKETPETPTEFALFLRHDPRLRAYVEEQILKEEDILEEFIAEVDTALSTFTENLQEAQATEEEAEEEAAGK